jgi:hypothetical protein
MAAVTIFDDIPPAPPMLDRAAIEQARLVRLARDHLASNEPSVDYAGLAEGRGGTILAARQWVKRQRGTGRLFVVDHGNGTLIPSFQLDEVFDLNRHVAPVIHALVDFGMHGWAIWQWFTASNPWIDARPVDVIGTPALEAAVRGLTGPA